METRLVPIPEEEIAPIFDLSSLLTATDIDTLIAKLQQLRQLPYTNLQVIFDVGSVSLMGVRPATKEETSEQLLLDFIEDTNKKLRSLENASINATNILKTLELIQANLIAK